MAEPSVYTDMTGFIVTEFTYTLMTELTVYADMTEFTVYADMTEFTIYTDMTEFTFTLI